MKRNYLMTGMKYPCKGDVRLLKSTMEHLEKTMPEMLVVKTYNKYGAVLKVVEADDEAEMEATRGVISRMDLPEMLQLMVFTGYDVLKARMVELSVQGAFAVLEVDVPEGFVTRRRWRATLCGKSGVGWRRLLPPVCWTMRCSARRRRR